MKNRPLVYTLLALTFVAIVWRISHPPQPPIPGPIGSPAHWRSVSTTGSFVALQVNPDGSQVAGVWVDTRIKTVPHSGLHIMQINEHTQIGVQLPDGFSAHGLSWKANNIIVAGSMPDGKSQFLEVDAATQTYKTLAQFETEIGNVLSWSSDSIYLLSEITNKQNITLTVISNQGLPAGKPVVIPNSSLLQWSQSNALSLNGDCAVISLLSNTDSSGFPNYYFCDFQNGKATLISNKLPGRVQNALVSKAGVLLVCVLRGKSTCVLYTPQNGKLQELKSVPVAWSPSTLWPNSGNHIVFFTNDSVLQVDLSTLSVTKLISFKDVDSSDSAWQTMVAGAQCAVTGSGSLVSFNIDAGEPDIRLFSKSDTKDKYTVTSILPRQ